VADPSVMVVNSSLFGSMMEKGRNEIERPKDVLFRHQIRRFSDLGSEE
jgi:hypothetical protein